MNEFLLRNWLKTSGDTPTNTYPFNSSSQRNIHQPNNVKMPGPGTYNLPALNAQNTSKYHVNRQKKTAVDKQFQWMISDDRALAFTIKENNTFIGPGAYQVNQTAKSPQQAWGKSSRFNKEKRNLCQPGPGSYDYNLKFGHLPGAQSAFKSKLVKINDSLVKSTAKKYMVKTEQFEDSDSEIQDNKRDQINSSGKNQDKSAAVFSSKVPRFVTEVSQFKVGPGSYDLNSSTTKIAQKPQFPKMLRHKKQHQLRQRIMSEIGPGSYNLNKYQMGRQIQTKGYACTRQTRFNFRKEKKNNSALHPGPGQYMVNKYSLIKREEVLNTKEHKPFKSFSLHQIKQKDSNTISNTISKDNHQGPGTYNLNMFDINFRLKRKKDHNQRLRLMEVSVPAFNSKAPRLN